MKVAKKIILTVPGIGRVETLPGGTFNPGGKSFSPLPTESGRVLHTEDDNPSSVSFKVPNLPGYLESFRGLSNVNVNIKDETGQSWIMPGAFVTSVPGVSGGEINVEMQASPAEQI